MNESERVKKAQQVMAQSAPVFQQMGHIASDWAMLEFQVNECIWHLANIAPVLGACITAQIFTINNRLYALIALLRLRGFSEDFIKEINKFADNVRSPAEKRNRVIHDPIFVQPEQECAGRLEITAQRKPVFDVIPVSVEDLKDVRKEIWNCTRQFIEFRQKILDALPTLPEIPISSPLPIDVSLVIPK